MSVTAPPRPARSGDPADREQVEALVEALIEEARQRARRRRHFRMAIASSLALIGVGVFAVFDRTAQSQNSSLASKPRAAVSGGRVRVVIAGTNDRRDVRDGSLVGTGTFKASGAITDAGTALGYRTVTARGTLITLRFVAKGEKGTITYLVKIHTNTNTARWTIASATGAYKGLHGKGTETENASYTISILRGTVSH